ncbi:MAG TPA: protein kinase [Polyangia bacterium]|nr:protein kinase [Polyangia bacterium]
MDARAEERILRLALRQGLVTHEDLAALPPASDREAPSARFGPRVDLLIARGRLDAAAVERLLRDATVEEPPQGVWGVVPAAGGALGAKALAKTLPDQGDSSVQSRKLGFPVRDWDRYQFVRFIAEGGMGDVYKAYDPRLKRYVALKFWRGASVTSAQRFMQEAQAQARVEHGNICKVYEVGEVSGLPYIAMQFIEGQTLGVIAKQLSLDQKLKVMAQVTEAVQAAHSVGLIHRDIKPSNIMIDRGEDGSLKPYVLDFGLAREMVASGLTRTGAVMGTPDYMAPEQARGELDRLDRRTDVYSLGATLFELVAGRPPFQGSVTDVLLQVLNDDPAPLRKIDPTIPRDVETMVGKCLEKQPHRRYQSAKELAADLGRYLDGDPILARRASPAYRLYTTARKHRAIVVVSSLAALVAIGFGGAGIYAWRTATERAQLAQTFGQEVAGIEGTLRSAYLLPLHDVRPAEAEVRSRMAEIERKMKRLGRSAVGPGEYALGRGYFALREPAEARQHLERAWSNGYRSPEVAYALGLALGALYERELTDVELQVNREARASRRRELERAYRDPALAYLKQSQGMPTESSAYVQGLIARYEHRYNEALAYTHKALEQAPGLYEARRLEGDVHMQIGNQGLEKGAYDAVIAEYERASQAYRAALEIARSDATVYEGECYRGIMLIKIARARRGSPKEAFEQTIASCDQALIANPGRPEVLVKQAGARALWAQVQMEHGQDPRATIDRALEALSEAIRQHPKDALAQETKGTVWHLRGEYELQTGLDPRPSLAQAAQGLETAARLAPNAWTTQTNLGNSFAVMAEYEMNHGLDPRPALERAIAAHRKSIELHPTFATAHDNLSGVYAMRAQYERDHGIDARPSLELATASAKKAVELNPSSARTHVNLASAYGMRGMLEERAGQDPRPWFALTVEACRKAVEIKPDFMAPLVNLGITERHQAQYELEHGLDATASLNEARRALGRAAEINRTSGDVERERGWVELSFARQAIHAGESPEADFANAQKALERAVEINGQDATAYRALALVHLEHAQWLAKGRGAPRSEITKGLAATNRALEIHPRQPEALGARGKLELELARTEPTRDRRAAAAGRARATLEDALALEPALRSELAASVQEATRLAGSRAAK